jgi:ankyrin repeat protein
MDDKECAQCNKKPANSFCSKCEATFYCGRECQVAHWRVHKSECKAGTSKEKKLFKATKEGNKEQVMELLREGGVDVNYHFPEDETGVSSLVLAIENDSVDIVEALLGAGCSVSASRDCMPSLMLAVLRGNMDIVSRLLSAGAAVNDTDKDGVTSLMIASVNGYTNIVKALLEAGADANKMDSNNADALYCSCAAGHSEVVQLLLAHGATGTAEALDIAKRQEHSGIVDILKPFV